ncbi:MAG TPA: hypothetical protein VK923_07325 [Euzebyales bacterium]|nr:hypothetical protein [Euzebyales bacterium]
MDLQVAEVVACWRRAEERLYPVVMVDPERYTRIVSVIRATADRLSAHDTPDELVRARARGSELVAASCAAVGVPVAHLPDLEVVADAAFGLRHREVEAEQRRQRMAAGIVAARARGDTWVTLDESGQPDPLGAAPYQRIDMRLDDGSGIRMSIDVDPDSYRPVYTLERLRLDPVSGAVTGSADADRATFADPAAWRAAFVRWRDADAERPRCP